MRQFQFLTSIFALLVLCGEGNRYAIANAAIGQVIPYRGFLPTPAAWMRQGIFFLCGDRGIHRFSASSSASHPRERHYFKP